MKYFVVFNGDSAKVEPVPHDIYLDKLGMGSDDGYTYKEACARVATHYEELANKYWEMALKGEA